MESESRIACGKEMISDMAITPSSCLPPFSDYFTFCALW